MCLIVHALVLSVYMFILRRQDVRKSLNIIYETNTGEKWDQANNILITVQYVFQLSFSGSYQENHDTFEKNSTRKAYAIQMRRGNLSVGVSVPY